MMKGLVVLAIVLCGLQYATGQPMVRADSLRYYEGKVITVCSEVTGTFCTKSPNRTTFLNFGNFPSQLFTVVIFEDHLKNFSYDPAVYLKGKNICVIGDVRMLDSGPEIFVEGEEQITIKE